jgi:hypothetical protein
MHGLPSDDPLHIVSLLGHKPDGFSEFDYYQFRSQLDDGPKPTIQEWLAARSSCHVIIDEYPTIDRQGVPADVLAKAGTRITQLLADGRLVVVVDSAGAERTARVCEAVGWRRDTEKER